MIGLLGLLDTVTNLLDNFIFTSNIELLAMNDVITLGVTFLIFLDIQQITISKTLLWMPFVGLFLFAVVLFLVDWSNTRSDLMSDYGFLNTYEYLSIGFFSAIIGFVVSTYILIKTLQVSEPPINLIFIIFGIILNNLGSFIEFGLGDYLFNDTSTHLAFLTTLIPVKLITSKSFIILGITWKN